MRNVSSPVLKLITIYRLVNEFMAALMGAANSGPHEADNLIVTIFYILVTLQTSEAKFLGARFIEECAYIDSLMHEEQIGLIEEYTSIEHIKVVIDTLQKGLRKCESLFINPGSEGSSGSQSSRSGSANTNAVEEEETQLQMRQLCDSDMPSTIFSEAGMTQTFLQ